MRDEEHYGGIAFVLGFTFGLAVGAGAALLLAPQSGRRTRRELRRRAEGWREAASDRMRDLRDEAEEAARRSASRVRERVEDVTGR